MDADSLHVTLLDAHEPGRGGASAAAAGLLHEFRPRPKTKMWNYRKGLDAALYLLAKAEAGTGERLVSMPGILKFAYRPQGEHDFEVAARRFPNEVQRYPPGEVAPDFPDADTSVSRLLLRRAHVVDTPAYMSALWRLCTETGRANWVQQSVPCISTLLRSGEYDNVVVCAGAGVKQMQGLEHVPVTRDLGHNLVLHSDPAVADPLPVPLMAGSYIVPQGGSSREVIAGATHERDFTPRPVRSTDPAQIDAVRNALSIKLKKMDARLFERYSVTAVQAGIRASPPRTEEGSVPVACEVRGVPGPARCWLLTGFAGRGLLYHAFMGRTVAHAVVSGREHHIPGPSRRLEITLKSESEVSL